MEYGPQLFARAKDFQLNKTNFRYTKITSQLDSPTERRKTGRRMTERRMTERRMTERQMTKRRIEPKAE